MRVETFLKRNHQLHHVIVIPHYDDEIIGCYQLFVDAVSKPNETDNSSITVIPVNCGEPDMGESDFYRRQESLQVTDYFRSILGKGTGNIGVCIPLSLNALFLSPSKHIYANCALNTGVNCIWFPDPLYEKHSEHVLLGNFGTFMSSTAAQDYPVPSNVLFGYYSINMQAPYVQPLPWKEADGKARVCGIFKSQTGYFASHGEATRFEGRRLA